MFCIVSIKYSSKIHPRSIKRFSTTSTDYIFVLLLLLLIIDTDFYFLENTCKVTTNKQCVIQRRPSTVSLNNFFFTAAKKHQRMLKKYGNTSTARKKTWEGHAVKSLCSRFCCGSPTRVNVMATFQIRLKREGRINASETNQTCQAHVDHGSRILTKIRKILIKKHTSTLPYNIQINVAQYPSTPENCWKKGSS